MHPDVEMAILTGYQSIEYLDYERETSCHNPLIKPKYDDANTIFETLEEENK